VYRKAAGRRFFNWLLRPKTELENLTTWFLCIFLTFRIYGQIERTIGINLGSSTRLIHCGKNKHDPEHQACRGWVRAGRRANCRKHGK
jgi:hypothetical protein